MFLRKSASILALLVFSGCSHNWTPAPGTDAADFEPAKARCSMIARHGGGSFMAVGSQAYVANAQIGYGIGSAVQRHRDFDDCMVMSGWRVSDEDAARSSADPGMGNLDRSCKAGDLPACRMAASIRGTRGEPPLRTY